MWKLGIRAGLSTRWLRRALCLVCLSLVGTRAAAAAPIPVIDGTGKLTGALGVDVGGALYDVAFVDGSCGALFSGCDEPSDFEFATLADALAASQALFDQVFVDSPLGNFDTDPSLTFGCEMFICHTLTPLVVGAHGVVAGDAIQGPSSDLLSAIALFAHSDFGLSSGYTFAKWSAQPRTVPEPATLVLFGAGLAGFTTSRRLRSRRER